MKLDVSSLKKAIAQLEEALQYCESDIAHREPKLALHLRAAAIQAFKFTYELSLQMLKRYLGLMKLNSNAIEEMNFNELIRDSYENGLLQTELSFWNEFRKERGIICHTYNEEKAQEVFNCIPNFLDNAKFLLNQFEDRIREI